MTDALLQALSAPVAPRPASRELARIDLDPAALERDLSRLVLTLVEFLRRLMEGQADQCHPGRGAGRDIDGGAGCRDLALFSAGDCAGKPEP
jgi:hypothetical protein